MTWFTYQWLNYAKNWTKLEFAVTLLPGEESQLNTNQILRLLLTIDLLVKHCSMAVETLSSRIWQRTACIDPTFHGLTGNKKTCKELWSSCTFVTAASASYDFSTRLRLIRFHVVWDWLASLEKKLQHEGPTGSGSSTTLPALLKIDTRG